MTATLTATETDLQVALRRVQQALKRLDEPLTGVHLHALRNDLTVIKAALLTLTRTGGG